MQDDVLARTLQLAVAHTFSHLAKKIAAKLGGVQGDACSLTWMCYATSWHEHLALIPSQANFAQHFGLEMKSIELYSVQNVAKGRIKGVLRPPFTQKRAKEGDTRTRCILCQPLRDLPTSCRAGKQEMR